jgi:HSP20 family protein
MFSYILDPRDPLQTLGVFRRRMNHLLHDLDDVARARPAPAAPRINLRDADDAFIVEAEVPGLGVDDIDVRATGESLTIRGERKESAPEGYSVHRNERRALRFSRSLALPARVDVAAVSAEVKDGILTVTLPKHPDVQPRAITVRAS